VNPKVKTKVVWVSAWFDPPKEAQAAQALLNQGADVLLQNTDSPAVLQTAAKAGKYAFGWDSNMETYAPEAHLGSVEINWGPYYVKAVKDVLENTWKSEAFLWGMKEGCIDLVSVSDKVPRDVKAHLEQLRAGMRDGSFAPWTGPIADSTGKEVVKSGERATDPFLLGIDFYVAGVEGAPPR
jgi:simple sugar transport system substrate-binding protein